MKKIALIALALSKTICLNSAPGDLDPTFGTGGMVTTDFGSYYTEGFSVVLQTDGKIIVAGIYSSSSYHFALARYNTNGTLDTSFGTNGLVTTDLSDVYDIARSVTLQADGKILVAGSSDARFAVVRYNTNGTLDTSFGTDGKVTTEIGDSFLCLEPLARALAIKVQSDDKVIASGLTHHGSTYDFALARYSTTGTLDATFGDDGIVITDFSSTTDEGADMAIQSDGKIIVAGISNSNFALARYNSDGSLDTTFGGDGKVTTDFSGATDSAKSVKIQSDGKIVVAGISHNGSNNDFALARYNSDGSLDTSFGGNGKVTTDFSGENDSGWSVGIQNDGKIVVAGSTYNGSDSDFALARYNSDGSLDTTFGGDGKVTTDFNGYDDVGNAMVIYPNGKIVVAGVSYYNFALARYMGDPMPTQNSVSTALATKYSG